MMPDYEQLAFRNRWVKKLVQQVEGVECFTPFVVLNPTDNLVVLNLSDEQYRQIFDCILLGADIIYPDISHQIMVNWLKGIHCPPLLPEQECFEYPTYAAFMSYSPTSPYLQPDEIPDGYESPPFLVNGENGVDLPNYEHFDVIVPLDAITLDVDWFETIDGQLPTIKVMVQGEGKAYIKMLTIAAGGVAVITVDNPPDILDIIGGIVTGSDNIIDLNQDLVSLPPETAQELIFELDIVGTGLHTIYIVFLPIIDDSLIPIRFGGGFRGVQLCNFVEQPEMGLTAIRFQDCNLEQLIEGEWSVVTGWENWLDCIPESVTDIRYQDGILQKLIDGVWLDVVYIEGLLLPIIDKNDEQDDRLDDLQFSVSLLESSDAAQQDQIEDLILSVDSLQGQVNALDTRLDNAELDIDDLLLSVAGLQGQIIGINANLDIIEDRLDVLDFGGAWSWIHDLETTNGGYIAGTNGSYVSSVGWDANTNGLDIIQDVHQIRENQITHVQAVIVWNSAPTGSLFWSINGGDSGLISYNGTGVESYGWLRVKNENSTDFEINFTGAGDYVLKALRYLGRGSDIPFD